MKNALYIFTTLLLLSTSLLAEYEQDGDIDGYAVYKQKCQMCHIEMISKVETLKIFKTLKAPPMVEVSTRLKENILLKENDEEVKRSLILTFMRDYIMDPNLDKSMCHLGAIDRFGVMPSQKNNLTEAELDAVTQWIYDRYEGKDFK